MPDATPLHKFPHALKLYIPAIVCLAAGFIIMVGSIVVRVASGVGGCGDGGCVLNEGSLWGLAFLFLGTPVMLMGGLICHAVVGWRALKPKRPAHDATDEAP